VGSLVWLHARRVASRALATSSFSLLAVSPPGRAVRVRKAGLSGLEMWEIRRG
jgi:hypothetical protein